MHALSIDIKLRWTIFVEWVPEWPDGSNNDVTQQMALSCADQLYHSANPLLIFSIVDKKRTFCFITGLYFVVSSMYQGLFPYKIWNPGVDINNANVVVSSGTGCVITTNGATSEYKISIMPISDFCENATLPVQD